MSIFSARLLPPQLPGVTRATTGAEAPLRAGVLGARNMATPQQSLPRGPLLCRPSVSAGGAVSPPANWPYPIVRPLALSAKLSTVIPHYPTILPVNVVTGVPSHPNVGSPRATR
jgi:hypothetical protein